MALKNKDGPEEIRALLAGKKLILGTDRTLKELMRGTLAKVFVSSNCPILERIAYACKIANVPMIELSATSEEVGVLCKKPFAISVLGGKA